MIKVVDVSHHYGARPVLSHISLDVPAGELVVLMGPNGVGKSTLLNVIAGVMSPAKGHVEINGLRRRSSEDAEIQIRRQVAYLPDQPWLPSLKTGREWLMAIGSLYDLDPEKVIDHIARLLDLFQLTDKGDSPIRAYSTGQQKKLAICGTLVAETPVMILDEPFTGGLDAAAILALSRVLKHLTERGGKTIVMASQLGETSESLARRVAILEGTKIKAYDTLEALRRQTGCNSLAEIYEKLVSPRSIEQIDAYFKGSRA